MSRHIPLGPSKPNVSSEDVNKVYSSEEALVDSTHADHNSSELQKGADQGISVGDASTELSNEHTKFSVELPQALQFNCGSPSYDPPLSPLCRNNEAKSLLELPAEAASDVAYVREEDCKTASVEPELHLQGPRQIDSRGEGLDCVWDGLIPNATDLLIFNSPNEAEAFKGLMQRQSGSSMRLSDFMPLIPQSTINNGQKIQMLDSVASGSKHEIEIHCSEPIAARDTDHLEDEDNLPNVALMDTNLSEKMDDKVRKLSL